MLDKILQEEIDKIYGPVQGKNTGRILIPAFLGDFRKVMEGNDLGVTVSEEYMTEDKKMHLVLKGQRRFAPHGFDFIVVSCLCNNVELLENETSIGGTPGII